MFNAQNIRTLSVAQKWSILIINQIAHVKFESVIISITGGI